MNTANFPDLLADPASAIDLTEENEDEEDFLLEELLEDDEEEDDCSSLGGSEFETERSEQASVATSIASSDDGAAVWKENREHLKENREDDHLHLDELQREVNELKKMVERKNYELDNMNGQLRRAVSTKCDLVIAGQELELHHEYNVRRQDNGVVELKKANLDLVEQQSQNERGLLNVIVEVAEGMKEDERKHNEKLKAWEVMHHNEICLKDYNIAKLREQIRILKTKDKNAPVLSFTNLMSMS
jgi:hypothetical protein